MMNIGVDRQAQSCSDRFNLVQSCSILIFFHCTEGHYFLRLVMGQGVGLWFWPFLNIICTIDFEIWIHIRFIGDACFQRKGPLKFTWKIPKTLLLRGLLEFLQCPQSSFRILPEFPWSSLELELHLTSPDFFFEFP